MAQKSDNRIRAFHQTEGSVRVWNRKFLVATLVGVSCLIGCHRFRLPRVPVPLLPPPPIEVPVANPSRIGIVDEEFLWRMIVDSVDDYFRIESELPVRRN
ncbi:MAG: hypothetical protein AAGG44_18745, partial [Planctomycetota bacterium]